MATLKSFTSSTLEGAFLEAAFLLQGGELNYYLSGDWKTDIDSNSTKPINGNDLPNYINITVDTDQQRCVITATLPIGVKSNSFGGYLLVDDFADDKYVYQQ